MEGVVACIDTYRNGTDCSYGILQSALVFTRKTVELGTSGSPVGCFVTTPSVLKSVKHQVCVCRNMLSHTHTLYV